MKKNLLIAMRGLMAVMAVAPLLTGCADKNVVAPGKNDTPEVKESKKHWRNRITKRLPGKTNVERREHTAPGARFYIA